MVSARVRRNRWIAAGVAALVVIVGVVIAVVASGGSNHKAVPSAPLTGLPDPDGIANHRFAITVKVNNTDARPQAGIDQADVVYEEVVETGITRLAAMFNSHAPDKVGPVRSVRRTDQSVVWPVGGVFVYSGGAQYAIDSIDTAPVKQLDETRAGSMMFRDPPDSSFAPYNLWAHVDQMFRQVQNAPPVPPPPLFVYRGPKDKVSPAALGSVHVGFAGGYDVTWTWDPQKQTWLRTTHAPAAPDVDAEGVRISAANVVVLFVNYQGGVGVEGSEAQLIGKGSAIVFTAGGEIKGTWSRSTKNEPEKLTDAQGNEIKLTPGKTWVELPDVSYSVTTSPAS